MSIDETDNGAEEPPTQAKLEANLARIEAMSARFLAAISQARQVPPGLAGPSPDLYAKAATAWWHQAVHDPAKLIEQQIGWWGETVKHYVEAQQHLAQGRLTAPSGEEAPAPKDKRFANPLWESHPYFNYIKQQYLVNAAAIEAAVDAIELEPREKKRLAYFSRQIVELLSPTNFLATNPDALERAVETEGQSLVDGLENLVADLEANAGDLVVSLADRSAFRLGENLATTPGSVVYRNHLFELIQYAPSTKEVHKIPVVIFPPWINKFYILDLKEKNSFIKWLVDQGYTVFVVSWINPTPGFRETGLLDYIEQGYLTAMTEARKICGTRRVNAIGYCIGGTTLSLTLALLKKRGEDLVKSATFFTTMTDFSDQGEMGVFLDDGFVTSIEAEAEETGIMDKFYMARTFSFLRAGDLIYRPAVRSYMMGEPPPAFDLLFWNGDGTNLPAKMAVEYLRGLCQQDRFVQGGFPLGGERVHISDVTVPLCSIACETDHIAAWRSCYEGFRQYGSEDKTFLLSESGHIAGIVNPPSKKKYGHYTGGDLGQDAEGWRQTAQKHDGSWWPRWEAWLRPRAGKPVPARQPGDSGHPPLGRAPGSYVLNLPAVVEPS
ncbi:PHA/PHB synthase family protein [Pseudoroseicyclus tamaricis]|uniref:Class I poly(R)-hydroxyalkanoic acid synthase n=1 Tax=Pseudoroseicyclus tamaricis TaxID=2705421 RepID=A0A6B2JXN9_9RHOB|nr:class I poly(R)-hydroxyalkanoic acid synthase [Pseudoroseicyclus tamaricis]NDV01369.1 class I poly(R)-hydroxyalkanoic acid synthase [Pseudoroseicyclus tamaricis]